MPGGGRQWNKSAGKEREKTGKRASKTRHGGTGGERRAAPVTRRSGCHALRGLTGPGATWWVRGDDPSSPPSRGAESLPTPAQTLSSPQLRGRGQAPRRSPATQRHRRGRDSGEQGDQETSTTGSVAVSRSRAASTRTGGCRVRRSGGDSKKEDRGWAVCGVEESATREEKKEQQTGRKTEEDTGRAGVEWRTYLIRSMPRLWRS